MSKYRRASVLPGEDEADSSKVFAEKVNRSLTTFTQSWPMRFSWKAVTC